MTPQERKVMELALEALESGVKTTADRISWTEYDCELMEQAITAIENALAQPKKPEQGEPVVVVVTGVYGGRFIVEPANSAMVLPVNMALYAHPQPRKPLTGEVVVIAAQSCLSPQQYDHFEALLENDQDAHNRLARAIEAAHNIKE